MGRIMSKYWIFTGAHTCPGKCKHRNDDSVVESLTPLIPYESWITLTGHSR